MDNEETGGTSRRKFLRNVGLGAAVAWSAPVLTTVGMSAASGTPVCSEGYICGGQITQCGDNCFCTAKIEGGAQCGSNFGCGSSVPCQTSAECEEQFGPGYFCQAPDTGCCGQVCAPPCGTTSGSSDGPTNLGR